MAPLKKLGEAKAGIPEVLRIGIPTQPSPVCPYTEATPNAKNMVSTTNARRILLNYDHLYGDYIAAYMSYSCPES